MTLETIKKLAEAASIEQENWEYICLEDGYSSLATPFVRALSPATTLKLWKMIWVLREGVKSIGTARYSKLDILQRVAEIERSLGERS